ncbi:hypothetical protein IQ268_28200 [Oculatella sp. LEGE 06141]|uniref:hypothetical protein n=1 Tax=Oculatella sp. LEGE 06141 TaxID=1828648 RepID=UPI00187F7946|nr:hypothetical protein [Oculatella sp. LEGE 06141]MBE9182435.1 hypothetical protein [Oculatella sp. LEGE 06141]
MNLTRIQSTLQTLFHDDSRWAHQGQRVVFWYDPDQQFQETFAELHLDEIEKLQLDYTPFTVKHCLLSRFLLIDADLPTGCATRLRGRG